MLIKMSCGGVVAAALDRMNNEEGLIWPRKLTIQINWGRLVSTHVGGAGIHVWLVMQIVNQNNSNVSLQHHCEMRHVGGCNLSFRS